MYSFMVISAFNTNGHTTASSVNLPVSSIPNNFNSERYSLAVSLTLFSVKKWRRRFDTRVSQTAPFGKGLPLDRADDDAFDKVLLDKREDDDNRQDRDHRDGHPNRGGGHLGGVDIPGDVGNGAAGL